MTLCPNCKINQTDAALCERCEELASKDGEIERLNDEAGSTGMYVEKLKEEIEKLREAATVKMSMHLVTLSAIAHDDAMECRCGHDPYTDGEPCPKCFAIRMYDEMFNRAPEKVKSAMANKPQEATPA